MGEKAPEGGKPRRKGRSTRKEEERKKATREEGAERKRKAAREEEEEMVVERSGKGEATKPNAASRAKRTAKTETARCATARALLGWTNAGIAGDVSGRSIPSRPRLPPLFSPVDLVQLERELRRDRSSSMPSERSFESGNPARGTERRGYPGPGVLIAEIFVPDRLNCALELRRDFREPIIQEN